MTLRPTQLTRASFLQKKSNVGKYFFDIFNTEIAQYQRHFRNKSSSIFKFSKNKSGYLTENESVVHCPLMV